MNETRELNIRVFNDTKSLCETNKKLRDSIHKSNNAQYIVSENEDFEVTKQHRFKDEAKVLVSKRRSLEAASRYKGQKVCVHNFASATNPGGGVVKGATAQEEAICRCSTLYFSIKNANSFYNSHKQMIQKGKMDVTYNDDCIYTPGVVAFKSDEHIPKLLPQEEWYDVDVITCAAPNLRENPSNKMNPNAGIKPVKLSDEELKELHIKRMRRILDIAKREKEDVIILGAFGCGAFYNPPEVVAKAMKQVVEEYKYDFKVIEFAIYCSKKDIQNYEIFKEVFKL